MRGLIISMVSGYLIQGCSAQALYNSAQGARQQQCEKLADSTESARCYETANQHYDHYVRDQNDKPKE